MYAALLIILALILISLIVGISELLPPAPPIQKSSDPPRDVRALVSGLSVPALRFAANDDGPTESFLGGTPQLPENFAWPQKDGKPLTFLANINLAVVQAALPIDWLPSTGSLLFFYDVENQPWGFDPNHRGGWAVIHFPGDTPVAGVARTPTDALLQLFVRIERFDSLPGLGNDRITSLDLSDEERDEYETIFSEAFAGGPHHQIVGFPDPVQNNDMERECQLASNGINCGGVIRIEKAKAQALEAGIPEWRLLLQLDSDDRINVMWGDVGMLYFWVRESDARRGDFSNVWLVLQCG